MSKRTEAQKLERKRLYITPRLRLTPHGKGVWTMEECDDKKAPTPSSSWKTVGIYRKGEAEHSGRCSQPPIAQMITAELFKRGK